MRNQISAYDSPSSESDPNANTNATRRSHNGWTSQQPQRQRNVNWSNAPTDINRYHTEPNWHENAVYANRDVQNSGAGSGFNATSHGSSAGPYHIQYGAMSSYGRPTDHDFRSCSRHTNDYFCQNATPVDDNRNFRAVTRSSTGDGRTGSNLCAIHTPWLRDDRI